MQKLPANIEAEAQVLGSILIDDKRVWDISDIVEADDFHADDHRKIFEIMLLLRGRGRPITPVTVSDAIKADDSIKISVDDLDQMADSVINPRTAIDYARQIADHSMIRSVMRAMHQGLHDLSTLGVEDSRSEAIDKVEGLIFSAVKRRAGQGIWLHDAMDELVKELQSNSENDLEARGYSWGLPEADEIAGLLMPGRQYMVAAMSGFGKSAFGMQAGLCIAQKAPVVYYSLEMPYKEHATRRFASDTEISATRIERGSISIRELETMAKRAHDERGKGRGVMIQEGSLTIAQIRANAMRMKRVHGIGAIVIDHLRLIEPSDPTLRNKEFENALQITKASKDIAKELDIAVIMLGQLKQADLYQRANNRPRSSDIYGGGSIEQNMDVILFINRPEVFLENQKPTDERGGDAMEKWEIQMEKARGVAEIMTGKRRGGRSYQSRKVVFDAPTTTFRSLADPALKHDPEDDLFR